MGERIRPFRSSQDGISYFSYHDDGVRSSLRISLSENEPVDPKVVVSCCSPNAVLTLERNVGLGMRAADMQHQMYAYNFTHLTASVR